MKDTIFRYTVSTSTIAVKPEHHLLGVHGVMEVLVKPLSLYKICFYMDLYSV